MPLSGSAFWAVILPVEKPNLLENPSGERGTFGWGTMLNGGGTVGTTSAFQQFGAWAGSCAPTGAANVGGARLGTFAAGNGTAYTASVYVRGGVGSSYVMRVDDNTESTSLMSVTFTTGGTWHRYVGSFTENSGVNRVLTVGRNGAGGDAFYFDGAQIEVGSLTTYLDGDQEGCYWLGQQHRSRSIRSGTYRGGGSVVALADLGLKPDETPGAGMPPLETLSQSFALDPGSEFLNQRASERTFTLTCQPLSGTTQQDYHRVRRNLIMALKADTTEPQSPVRLWYTGGLGTIQIDAVLAGGFETGDRESPMTEDIAARFVAHDPYWYATTQQGTALAGRVGIGSALYLVARDPYGRWGTLGANGSTFDGEVRALAYNNGSVIIGGAFGSTAGTRSGGLSFYSELTSGFGTFGGTVEGANGVRAVTVDADGTIYFGGAFTNISGLSNTRFIARYSGGFATITGGTVNNSVRDFAWQGGTLCIGGAFTGVAGTTTGQLALWTRAGYGSTSNGTINTEVFGVAVGLNKTIYAAIQSAAAANVAGTQAFHIAQYFGSWGTMGTAMEANGAGNNTVAVGPNGVVYAGGEFNTAGGGSAMNVAQWSGVQWSNMGSGVGQDTAGVIEVNKMIADPLTGDVYQVGARNTGALNFPDNMARWNGYRWLPLDVDLPGANNVNTIMMTPARALYIGGAFTGTAQVAGVAQIVNSGMADAYPIFKARNTSGGTIALYQLINTLTGAALYFDLRLEIGEEVTYISDPEDRSFTSSFRGNIFNTIVPGSNPTDFALKSGTNYLSFFADSGSVAASVYWTPRGDSFDMGTNY